MSWMFSPWLAVVFLGICRGHNTLFEGYDLSMSSYHLCTGHETTVVSRVLSYKTPYTERRLCGGWLPWKTCEVTLYRTAYRTKNTSVTKEVIRCCDGYEQVGSYCTLPLNRSGEFTAKPGFCPEAEVAPRGGGCEWDTDCLGWQKCCQAEGISNCTDPGPASSRVWCFNVTVTVKTDYKRLMSMDGGILNHTRLLHSMVTGALDSPDVSVYYISSWPVGPFKTSSSLLISSPETLFLSNITTKLHLLLKHIEEISSVSVEALSSCSPQTDCTNTEGSYSCNPNNTGVHCQAAPINTTGNHCQGLNGYPVTTTMVTERSPNSTSYQPTVSTELPTATATVSEHPLVTDLITAMPNSTHTPPTTTHDPGRASTRWTSNMSEISPTFTTSDTDRTSNWSETTAIRVWSTSTSVKYINTTTSLAVSPPASSGPEATSMEHTVAVSQSVATSTCYITPPTNLHTTNVSGSSFCLSWTSQSQSGLMFLVVLMQGSEVKRTMETNLTVWEVTGVQSGVLYNVIVTPCACGSQGTSLQLHVKTAAKTLGATARLTNMNFTDDLLDPNSQAYQNLTRSIEEEIQLSLPPNILVLVVSGDVRVQITGLFPGSVMVNFTIVFTPSQTWDIMNVSSALMASLQNSSIYTVDSNNTSINDFDECSSGEMDCSPWAMCINTWSSYSCVCLDGYTDTNPTRPGQACQASLTTTTQIMSITTPVQMTTALAATITTTSVTTTSNTPVATTTTINNTVTTITNPTITSIKTVRTTTPLTATIPVTITSSTPVTTSTTIPVTTKTITEATTITTELITAIQVSHTESITVECRASAITVTVARELLVAEHIIDSALYLGIRDCGINGGNSSHAQLTVAWDECDTQVVHNSTHYTAKVTLFNSMSPMLWPDGSVRVPTIRLKVPILCTYRRSILISTGYSPTGYNMIKDAIMGSGMFHVTVQLLNGTSPLPQNYTLASDEDVVVEVSVNTSVEQIKVVINKCWATQTSDPTEPTPYVFLENSCPLPHTYTTVLQNGNSSKSRLSLRIFSFVNLNAIYLHCQIQICIETGSATCQPDCTERTERFSNSIGTAKATCGPFFRSDEGSNKEKADTLRLVGYSLLGIGLSLLFLGSLACLFFYHRKRIGHYNFSLKPKQENFTYHVFDT